MLPSSSLMGFLAMTDFGCWTTGSNSFPSTRSSCVQRKKLYKFQIQNNLLIPKRNGLILRLFKAGEILAYPSLKNICQLHRICKQWERNIWQIFNPHETKKIVTITKIQGLFNSTLSSSSDIHLVDLKWCFLFPHIHVYYSHWPRHDSISMPSHLDFLHSLPIEPVTLAPRHFDCADRCSIFLRNVCIHWHKYMVVQVLKMRGTLRMDLIVVG